jgi:fermentation-respiration switch protein FrsA (DUF1100 family)
MGRASVLATCAAFSLALGTGCTSVLGSSAFSGRTLEDTIVFQPRAYPEGDWSPSGLFEDAWFESADGTRLHGWFAEAKQPRAVVLYMHGNGGNVSSRRDVLQLFRDQLGSSVLVFDYRGYGRSEGVPTEEGVLADARAARRWLAAKTGVREEDIVLVGHSLGGGVAVDLAARDGTRGLVLENTFTSLPDVARSHFPLLPFRHLMHSRLDSVAKIPSYHGPLLVKHGDDDETVPYAFGEKLFAAANEPKQFISIPGGRHNDPPSQQYLTALDQFLCAVSVRD